MIVVWKVNLWIAAALIVYGCYHAIGGRYAEAAYFAVLACFNLQLAVALRNQDDAR